MRVSTGYISTDEASLQACIGPEPNGVYRKRTPIVGEPERAAPEFERACQGAYCIMGWRYKNPIPDDMDIYGRLEQLGYCGLAGRPAYNRVGDA